MKLLHSMLVAADLLEADGLDRAILDAKQIITKYTSAENTYDDFIMRLAGFTNGIARANPETSDGINVIPVLSELTKKGYVRSVGNGRYKRTDVLSRLISQAVKKTTDRAIDGDPSKNGKLGYTQSANMSHMAGDGGLGSKLANAPRNYKAGGKYSGDMKEAVLRTTRESDPAWLSLPEPTKNMVIKLNTIENPLYAFKVLNALIKLRDQKKGYVPFIKYIETHFKDQAYIDALMDLNSAGIVDIKNGTLNNQSLKSVQGVMEFMEQEPIEGIKPLDKIAAFLPKFIANATTTSASTHRGLNSLVLAMHPSSNNKELKAVYNLIQTKLTDDKLDDILSMGSDEIKSSGTATRTIYTLATDLDVNTVNELKLAIDKKYTNRVEYAGDENKAAKEIGRVSEFKRLFSI